jgi:hypothetical protein
MSPAQIESLLWQRLGVFLSTGPERVANDKHTHAYDAPVDAGDLQSLLGDFITHVAKVGEVRDSKKIFTRAIDVLTWVLESTKTWRPEISDTTKRDAILTCFFNYVAMESGIDYAIYASDLKVGTELLGPPSRRGDWNW